MERPRSKGAKWTNKHIAADEKIEELKLETYEARRDRWNGYDAAEYSRVIDRYAFPYLARLLLHQQHSYPWQRCPGECPDNHMEASVHTDDLMRFSHLRG